MLNIKALVLFIFISICTNFLLNAQINTVTVKEFGAYGDGVHDDSYSIQKALDYIENIGGGNLIISSTGRDYLVSKSLYIGSNTNLIFEKSFLKLIHYTKIGTILINKKNAHNITIINPLINGNNIIAGATGENGISIGNGYNIKITGGIIKNCKKGKIVHRLGGKGIQVEEGEVKNLLIDGTLIDNCSWGISTQYDINHNKEKAIQINFNNIKIRNCENAGLIHQINGIRDVDNHVITIKNMLIENSGNDDGLFVLSRTRNLTIDNLKVTGEKKVGSFIRGRHSNCQFSNIIISQPLIAIINNKPSFHGQDSNSISENNTYDIIVNSPVDYIITTSDDYEYSYRELRNSILKINMKSIVLKDTVLPQAAWKTSIMEIYSSNNYMKSNTTEIVLRKKNKIFGHY